MYDVAVIGAGVIGASVARELSAYKLKTVIIEKDNDVGNGTTKANSAIIHAGYDAPPGSLKAKFNVLGNPMFSKICDELDVPFKRIGSLVIAFSDDEMETIRELYQRGITNGVKNLRILNGEETRKIEPNLNDNVTGALHAPDAGIICPFELTIAYAENAVENGAELLLNQQVVNIEKRDAGNAFRVTTTDQEIWAKYVINCAGLFADEINNMVSPGEFKITPRRGQYYVLDKSAGSLVNSIVFQCPVKTSKGVLVLPTVHGNLLVGPDAQEVGDKTMLDTTKDRLEYIRATAQKTIANIPFNTAINMFSGLRATPDTGDFIIGESAKVKGFINIAGIESPGLTAAPSIAYYVAVLVRQLAGNPARKDDFNPARRKLTRFGELSSAERAALIAKDPRYGRIVCRCEQVTEGEIVDAIHRKAGGTSIDSIKRRVRPAMGRCQGGFCYPRVMEILSRELGVDLVEVVKDSKQSPVVTGMTKIVDGRDEQNDS